MISTLLTVLALHAAQAAEVHRVALVMGANNGGAGRVTLRYAASDADSVGEVLTDLGGVAPDDLLVLRDPSRADVLAGLERLATHLHTVPGERTEAIVYYSGHSDETGLLLGDERLSYPDLKHALNALPADVRVGILDSCASGAMARSKGGVHRPPFLLDASRGVRGNATITSASADEAAQESDRVGGSFFTHFLLSGLRGAADVNADSTVTLREAYDFAFDQTLARTQGTLAGPQHAVYDFDLVGTGDVILTDLRDHSAGLVLPEDLDGRIFVRDAQNRLQVEVAKAFGSPLTLGLSPGRYQVHRQRHLGLSLATIDIAEGRPTTLWPSAFTTVLPEGATARGPLDEPHVLREPTASRTFLASSATSLAVAALLYSSSLRVGDRYVDPKDAAQARTGLQVSAGLFAGVGVLTGVGAAITLPQPGLKRDADLSE